MRGVSLLVLAAGLGSRFGGDKQIVTLGSTGRCLMHFNVMDAYDAGVRHVVLVIRAALREALAQQVLPHWPADLRVDLVEQRSEDLPGAWHGRVAPRARPWGTAHAVWVAREQLHQPFMVVNADDLYGRESLATLAATLASEAGWAMVAYRLDHTLSESGGVNRGLCRVGPQGLQGVAEWTGIRRRADGALEGEGPDGRTDCLDGDAAVSMNLWGFTPALFAELERALCDFLAAGPGERGECYLPAVVDAVIQAGRQRVRVLHTPSQWRGMTYAADVPALAVHAESLQAEATQRFLQTQAAACWGFGPGASLEPLGHGHINKTYVLREAPGQPSPHAPLVLQALNCKVFPEPRAVVDNALRIEAHLQAARNAGRYGLELLRHQASDDGTWLCGPQHNVRATTLIAGARSPELVRNLADARAVGLSFGSFAAALADFDASQLRPVLPRFHDLGWRYEQLREAAQADVAGRLADCRELYEAAMGEIATVDEQQRAQRALPLRVCHNDCKINNMLIDERTGEGRAVIDLDTCMPGQWMTDFGDMVRSCCSPVPEDSTALDQVQARPEVFEALLEGYLSGLGERITDEERRSLWLGARVLVLIHVLRFLADHLAGDVYYPVTRPGHNLDRARNQWALYQSLLAQRERLVAMLER